MIKLEMNIMQASAMIHIIDQGVRASGINSTDALVVLQPIIASLTSQYKEALDEDSAKKA